MNWHKAKTIMIVFLVIVNFALVTYISFDGYNTVKNENMVTNTVIELLKSKKIQVKKEIITDLLGHKNVKNIYATNVIKSYEEFAQLVIGKDIKKIDDSNFTSKAGEVTFKGDNFNVKASSGSVLLEVKDDNRQKKAVEKYLLGLGIDTTGATVSKTKENGETLFYFNKQADGLSVFKTGVVVKLNDKGITDVYGNWYNYSNSGTKADVKSISAVLVDYMNKYNENNAGFEITDLGFGYAIFETGTYHENIALIPSWRIENNKNEILYLDARENQ